MEKKMGEGKIIQPEKEIRIYHIGQYPKELGNFGREFVVVRETAECNLCPNDYGYTYVAQRLGKRDSSLFNEQELIGFLRAVEMESPCPPEMAKFYRYWDEEAYGNFDVNRSPVIQPICDDFFSKFMRQSGLVLRLRTNSVGDLIKEGLGLLIG